MLGIFGGCLLQVFGGMTVAALIAFESWQVFRILRLPQLQPWLTLMLLFVIPGAVRRPFVQMVMLFPAISALALLPTGRAWREQDRLHRLLQRFAADREQLAHRTGSRRSERPDQLI